MRQRSTDETEENDPKKPKEDILGALQKIKNELCLKISQAEVRTTAAVSAKIDSLETKIETKIEELEMKINSLSTENAELRTQNMELARRLQRMDKGNRRNNVVFTGITTAQPSTAKDEVNKLLETKIPAIKPIVDAKMITTKKGEKKIVATCKSYDDKIAIFKIKKSLKGHNNEKIFVNNDLTPEESTIQFTARKEAAAHRKNGKEVIIHEGKIKVDNDWWLYDETTKGFTKKGNFHERPYN